MERSLRPNMRMQRATIFTRILLNTLEQFIPYEDRADAHDALMALFHDNGAEIVTDDIRQAIGLPPRGPDGWTEDEIAALEQRRLELLLRPLRMVVPAGNADTIQPSLAFR